MNGDEIQANEIGQIIRHLDTDEPTKGCKAHTYMVQGCLKALRMGESNTKMLRLLLIISCGNLLSTWLKGGEIPHFFFKLATNFIGSAVGCPVGE